MRWKIGDSFKLNLIQIETMSSSAVLAAECKALDQAQRDQHDRCREAPGVVARQEADEERTNTHQGHRDQEGVFASDHVAEATEDQRAERPDRETRSKGEQRENKANRRRHVGEEVLCQKRAERAVDIEVVPLEHGTERRSENDLSLLSRHSSCADIAARCRSDRHYSLPDNN